MRYILRKMIRKEPLRPITRIEPDGILNVPLHGMRHAVITDSTERLLIDIEESVRSRKCLNQVLVDQHFVEIQRIDPL